MIPGTPMLTALLGIKSPDSHLVPSSLHINITSTNGCTDDYLNNLPFHLCWCKTLQTISRITPESESLKSDLPIKLRHMSTSPPAGWTTRFLITMLMTIRWYTDMRRTCWGFCKSWKLLSRLGRRRRRISRVERACVAEGG